jgi:hypothetical protein
MAVRAKKIENKVFVHNGKVMRWEDWVLWNGQLWATVIIKRTTSGFQSDIGDPEHGGGQMTGRRLEEVIQGLHPRIQKGFHTLFSLKNPTAETIRAAGFENFAIVAA